MRAPSWVQRKDRWKGEPPESDSEARRKILDAVRACCLGDSMRHVSMAEIAEEADISRATLYKYFSTREELYEAWLSAGGH